MTAPSTKEGVKVRLPFSLASLPPATVPPHVHLTQDVEVEKEDQMRINLFARKNARLLDIREKITEKEVREPRF